MKTRNQAKLEAKMLPTTADDEPFSLLTLPPEIWARIGKKVIDSAPRVQGWPFMGPIALLRSHQEAAAKLCQPAITRTCRALRAELLPYFYASRIRFNIYFRHHQAYTDDPMNQDKCAWLKSMGSAGRQCLTEVALCCEPDRVQLGLRYLREILDDEDVSCEVELSDPPMETKYARECAAISRMYGPSTYPLVFT
ncbi:hypothetical protein LTR35_009362 [Friedmanniomyces endolithicus]|uniref:Uncharacterized protein n=1 Tax=Friedmanniomyces endolithicus TaxID=329885 RepID=A0AAN6F6T8_9PEZI|nr:hypothetical protein LTS00_016420 [Friedmanniomyces endolithicus]KAK0278040.1 hypothetical protein LTR35_009362 [Friedmanniomyces endolithicus]KAK0303998.1 hypothetical protein LTR82_017362 [Friedmanniomyces endolithicus]KAK0974325.1 hypothetical protein LTR54_017133 [Friedmanniomyces endolithicus]